MHQCKKGRPKFGVAEYNNRNSNLQKLKAGQFFSDVYTLKFSTFIIRRLCKWITIIFLLSYSLTCSVTHSVSLLIFASCPRNSNYQSN